MTRSSRTSPCASKSRSGRRRSCRRSRLLRSSKRPRWPCLSQRSVKKWPCQCPLFPPPRRQSWDREIDRWWQCSNCWRRRTCVPRRRRPPLFRTRKWPGVGIICPHGAAREAARKVEIVLTHFRTSDGKRRNFERRLPRTALASVGWTRTSRRACRDRISPRSTCWGCSRGLPRTALGEQREPKDTWRPCDVAVEAPGHPEAGRLPEGADRCRMGGPPGCGRVGGGRIGLLTGAPGSKRRFGPGRSGSRGMPAPVLEGIRKCGGRRCGP